MTTHLHRLPVRPAPQLARASVVPTRVLIADDDPLARAALVHAIGDATGLVVAAEASDAQSAVARALSLEPELVLIDFDLPDLDGLSAALRIRQLLPETRVLVVASRVTEDLVVLALRAGTAGVVPKDLPVNALVRTVKGVMGGQAAVSRELLLPVLAHLRRDRGPEGSPQGGLTPRECEVLDLLDAGTASELLPARLGISAETVRRHLRSIQGKLGCGTAQETVAVARRLRASTPIVKGDNPDRPDIDRVSLLRAVERLIRDEERQ